MVKKLALILCALFICLSGMSEMTVKAETDIQPAGQITYLTYPEPAKSQTQGYIHVLLYNHDTSNYYVVTYFWTISTSNSEDVPTAVQGMCTLTNTTFEFNVHADKGTQSAFYTLYHINARGEYRCVMASSSQKYNRDWDAIYGGDVTLMGWKSGGNAYVIGANFTTDFTVYYSEDGSARLLMDVLSKLGQISLENNTNATDIWVKLNHILESSEDVETQLRDVCNYLNSIDGKLIEIDEDLEYLMKRADRMVGLQKDTNTWLEKIFNWLNESKEEEKQEITNQGGNSVSQGSDAIENGGAGFGDSLGGLVGSMNYTGTECSWTFPRVTLPAINGVMDETVLIEEQPINFGMWIDAIPPQILLLIRSVLTGALIIYCFKELYGTISYVLTLKGGGVNE